MGIRGRTAGIALVVGATLAAVVPAPPVGARTAVRCGGAADYRRTQACVRLNQIQVIGSHNSYHLRGREPFWSAFSGFVPDIARTLDYAHPPLANQFSDQAVRQIELDVATDPKGGRYATHRVLKVVNQPTRSKDPNLYKPGLKVIHEPEIDWETTCSTLRICLTQVRRWSQAHPNHVPIAVLLELKEDPTPDPLELGFVSAQPYTRKDLAELDATIRSEIPRSMLFTPDDLRGSAKTLPAAIRTHGWPTLAEARGKVLFLMDNEGSVRSLYLKGHENLAGRALFTSSKPGEPSAAFVKENDPMGLKGQRIRQLVRDGYVVRTRADADTEQARSGDTSMRDAALASGA
ncbi:MAG: Ca2+-dependent phosphoinositide-specific phospholipase C, partial [Actinomycetes bacterium]